MNKYVSPIMELEMLYIEDILMSNESNGSNDSEPGIGDDELPPVDLTNIADYYG